MKRAELYEAIAAEFELQGALEDQTILDSDLGFDSLGMFDLVLFVEELAGGQSTDRQPMDYPMMTTLGDVYAYWEALRANSRSTTRQAPIG